MTELQRARAEAAHYAGVIGCKSPADFMHVGKPVLIEINRLRAVAGTWSYEKMDPQYRSAHRG